MGCSQNFASVIPALLLAAFSLTIFPSHGILHENLVTICSITSNPSLCQKILGNDPQTTSADLPKLSLISINLTMKQADQNLDSFSKLSKNTSDSEQKKSFERCEEYYHEIQANIQKAYEFSQQKILLCFLRIPNISSKETMAFSEYSSQLLALFLMLLNVCSVLGDPATQQRIDRVCRQMEDYGFCNRTFNENRRGPADDVGLTLIANDQVLRNASNTYQFIEQLQASTSDLATRAALENCRIGCCQVRQAFVQAISYFNQRDYANMVKVERTAPRGEAFCRPPTPESPLVERKRELRILIAMAVVAGHILAP